MNNTLKEIESQKVSRRKFLGQVLITTSAIGVGSMVTIGILQRDSLRSANNMLRMGHCAPSIMQTLLDIEGIDNKDLVQYAGGLAGGVGIGVECGGITAPLMYLSLQNDYTTPNTASLNLIKIARRYIKEFEADNGSYNCSAISKNGMPACMNVMCGFHKPFKKAIAAQDDTKQVDEAYSKALTAFYDNKFHCVHNVFKNLEDDIQIADHLLRCSWIFIGGTACQNLTCGALIAGAMALGSKNEKVEDSYIRVLRMIWLIMNDNKDAMGEDINGFNRSINLCSELGKWFQAEFGSTSCRELCGCDFSNEADVDRYLTNNGIAHCKKITESVAQKVRMMIKSDKNDR